MSMCLKKFQLRTCQNFWLDIACCLALLPLAHAHQQDDDEDKDADEGDEETELSHMSDQVLGAPAHIGHDGPALGEGGHQGGACLDVDLLLTGWRCSASVGGDSQVWVEAESGLRTPF